MSKRVYISADYDVFSGDRAVVEELCKWGRDSYHKVDFIDMSNPSYGSVANGNDCRICDLKEEFNHQINASSAVIFVVGDMTRYRTAGSKCERASKDWGRCTCTPYKHNTNGTKACKVFIANSAYKSEDYSCINSFSYLRHEFEQAKKKRKAIIILYNSTRHERNWLPSYMTGYEDLAKPFWKDDVFGRRVGNYAYIKEVLGF